MYQIRVTPSGGLPCQDFIPQWTNFVNSLGENGLIWEELKVWKGRNVVASPMIEFETEEDALLFILAWS